MAKKNEKLLLGAALLGAAIGCGIAYFHKSKKEESWDEDFDEFQDEFDEDLDGEETTAHREYVTIPKEAHEAAEEVKEAISEEAETVKVAAEDIKETLSDAAEETKSVADNVKEAVAHAVENAKETEDEDEA